MRSIVLFAAVCSVVVCEIQIGERLNNACQKLCHVRNEAQATNFNLTRALKGCCDEASACVVPAHFYNVLCVKELMDVCNSAEKRLAANLSCIQQLCCGNLNSNETGREFKGSRRCFRNISVSWNDERFWTVRDERPIFEWNRKHWEFFLNMSTQTCLNSTERTSLTPSSVTIKFKYPIFAKRENYEKRFVHAFYAPASYLVMKKGDHDMLTVLGESVEHLWVTLCICITWTLISGVIIWLLDRRRNPLQFPSSFWQGVCEGTWWAVVTMTTVGYGDRSPRSLLARIYAAVWMIIGMVTLSTFTADVSSILTAREMMPRNTYLNRTVNILIIC